MPGPSRLGQFSVVHALPSTLPYALDRRSPAELLRREGRERAATCLRALFKRPGAAISGQVADEG